MNYVLDDTGTPVAEPDVLSWALWFQNAERRIAYTELPDDVKVSTVFLGIDHSFGHGPPLLFETMVFGGKLDETQCRYETREAALNGHAYYVRAAMFAATGEIDSNAK